VTTPAHESAEQPDVPTGPVEDVEALLADLDELPVPERVAVLDEVHRRLQDALATVDEA
jgi:hypothetical protein